MAGLAGRWARKSEQSPAETEAAAARAAFEQFIALERAYDPSLVDLYAEDGVVIEVTAESGEERRRREIPMRRYRAALPFALMLSKKAGERSEHLSIREEWIAPGWVIIKSLRVSSQSRAPAPYEITFRRDNEGRWRVIKESATLVR